ncbi:MAG: DNA/RNA non-specific endonuclease [Bryobacteraceae bacterium]
MTFFVSVPEAQPMLDNDLGNRLNAELGRMYGVADAEGANGLLSGESAGSFAIVDTSAEAIIIADQFRRPALLVRNNTFETALAQSWSTLLNAHRIGLEAAIRSVGRLELSGHPTLPYAGTAWIVGDNIAITNRHVASTFAQKKGASFPLLKGPLGPISARVDFREEFSVPARFEVPVEKVLFIADPGEQNPDMAVVQLAKGFALPEPIPLFGPKPRPDQNVAVIGYPANDIRNPSSAVADIFGSVFEVKRLSPGQVRGTRGFLVMHDCSTLGGNSGSVVVDMETGHAVGLHFGGRFRENNFAVGASEIKRILSKLKVQVAVPSQTPAPRASDAKIDLSDREGFSEKFLGTDASVRVPLPKIPTSATGKIAAVKGAPDKVLRYTHFSIAMHSERRFAFYTACNIDGAGSLNIRRTNDIWLLDPRIDKTHQVGNELYSRNDLDRGHLVRRLDPVWGDDAKVANDDTFFYTNATPQHARLNQGNWNDLEDYILNNTNAHDLRVNLFTGPVFADDDPEYRGVLLPKQFWKVVSVINGDTGKLHATGYMLSQADLLTDIEFVFGQFRTYQLPIATVETMSGLSFGKLENADPLRNQEGFMREIAHLRDIVL